MTRLVPFGRHDVRKELLPSDSMRAAYKFWCDAKGTNDIPSQGDVDLERIPQELRDSVSIVVVENLSYRLRFRMTGGRIKEAFGRDLSEISFEDFPDGKAMIARMNICVRSRAPYYSQGPMNTGTAARDFKALVMPLANSKNEVSQLLVYAEYF